VRQIVLDTETTGLDVADGHRIIEIGCVELMNRRLSGRHYHQYLWPEREIDAGAMAVHGITVDFLRNCPLFRDVVHDFIEFVRGAELVIHNASFDIGFLDNEIQLARPELGKLADYCRVVDSLEIARHMHPGQRNSLDALCSRYGIVAERDLHGALLDAEILADVYLAMTGGQTSLNLDQLNAETVIAGSATPQRRQAIPVIRPSEAELAAHSERLEAIDKASHGCCLWLQQTK
jgi:DNA polymerase-3 subunit epsilon